MSKSEQPGRNFGCLILIRTRVASGNFSTFYATGVAIDPNRTLTLDRSGK
jgi:hypothetical protein